MKLNFYTTELSERLFNLAEKETGGVSYASLTKDGYIHLDGTTFTVDLLKKIINLVELDPSGFELPARHVKLDKPLHIATLEPVST